MCDWRLTVALERSLYTERGCALVEAEQTPKRLYAGTHARGPVAPQEVNAPLRINEGAPKLLSVEPRSEPNIRRSSDCHAFAGSS